MKSKELRIGNIVQDVAEIEKRLPVFAIHNDYVDCGDETFTHPYLIDSLKGIQLTPEILEKCGFTYIEPCLHCWANSEHLMYEHKDGGWMIQLFAANDDNCHIHIHHLHQLQNLIYCLSGTELPINL